MATLYECDLHGCGKTVPDSEAVSHGWVSVMNRDGDGVYCTRSHAAQALGGVKAYTDEALQKATDAGYKAGRSEVAQHVADVLDTPAHMAITDTT